MVAMHGNLSVICMHDIRRSTPQFYFTWEKALAGTRSRPGVCVQQTMNQLRKIADVKSGAACHQQNVWA